MNAVISINECGDVRCLWTEALPLAELGRMRIERASTVEWSDAKQVWQVRLAGSHRVDFENPSRGECINWEINTINERLLNGTFIP